MKTIIYILIAVIVISIPLSALPLLGNNSKNKIHLSCTDSNPKITDLTAAVEIFEKRLKALGIKKYETKLLKHEASVQFIFEENINTEMVSNFLTTKADLSFSETLDRSIVLDNLDKNNKLFSMMDISLEKSELNSFDARLGTCKKENIEAVNQALFQLQQSILKNQNIDFAWTAKPSTYVFELYLLKKDANLDGKYVSKAKAQKQDNMANILLTFDKQGTKLWHKLTQENIGKQVAINLDHQVLCAPMVRGEISGGQAMITGSFTETEAQWIVTLIDLGSLPLDFEVME